MSKFVPDIKTRRWVVVAPKRALRPDDFKKKIYIPSVARPSSAKRKTDDVYEKKEYNYSPKCPFCLGNEDLTPPEVYRWGKNSPLDPHWLVRVIPNKYPIIEPHEVVIHSPDHLLDIRDLPQEHVVILFKVLRERYNSLKNRGQVFIFSNKGFLSGESLIHPHTQILVVPFQIKLDILSHESICNKVIENDFFVVYCPEFSQWPYEVWIAPKGSARDLAHKTFGHTSDEELEHLVNILKDLLNRFYKLFGEISYNFYISPGENWYFRFIPRLVLRGGVELGTGLHVNIKDPEDAARELRS